LPPQSVRKRKLNTMIPAFIRKRWYKWTEGRIQLPLIQGIQTERLGSPYGGWIIPKNFLTPSAVAFLVGAGEDVSFDLELAARSGCAVHIFDPTPRAIQHVEQTVQLIKKGTPAPCNTCPGGFYPEYPPTLPGLLHMHPVGLWHEDTVLRFFTPLNEAHVSHSIVNLQGSSSAIEVPVRRLSHIMEDLQLNRLGLLKIDIEGAEYQVLDSLLEDRLKVDVLCIEYDESATHHLDAHYMQRIRKSLFDLVDTGYKLLAKEPDCHNYTLMHQRCLA